jgi:hypothetical protein
MMRLRKPINKLSFC